MLVLDVSYDVSREFVFERLLELVLKRAVEILGGCAGRAKEVIEGRIWESVLSRR